MSDFWPISINRANDAYAAAITRRKHYQFAAQARRTIATAFDGAFCTKTIEPKIAALFPCDRVHYYIASYSGDKMLIVTHTTDSGVSVKTEIRLCRKGEKRISAADLIESAEFNEKQLSDLDSALAHFYDNISQYNVLCNCIRAASSRISAVMYCLDRPGSF